MATVAGVLVGLVLVASGALKLFDPGWAEQARRFGAPRPVAVALPWVELVLGALVAVRLAHPWTALAAVGLLALFTGAVLAHLVSGSRPPCACFGQRSAKPIGPWTVVRNVVLVALAVAAAS